MLPHYRYALQAEARKFLDALRKQKKKFLLGLAGVAFAAGTYAGYHAYTNEEPAPKPTASYEQPAARTRTVHLEHLVQPGERCETIVREYAAKNPSIFTYELSTPQAVQRAVNETAANNAARTDANGRTQTYLLEDRVSAYGVAKPDGETCDVIHTGTKLVFEYEEKQQQELLVVNATRTHTTQPNNAALLAIPLVVAGLGAGAALYGRSGEPKQKTREAFCGEAKQTQQASRHYKKTDAHAYRTERNTLATDMRRAGVRVQDIADVLGISRSTVYRM